MYMYVIVFHIRITTDVGMALHVYDARSIFIKTQPKKQVPFGAIFQ